MSTIFCGTFSQTRRVPPFRSSPRPKDLNFLLVCRHRLLRLRQGDVTLSKEWNCSTLCSFCVNRLPSTPSATRPLDFTMSTPETVAQELSQTDDRLAKSQRRRGQQDSLLEQLMQRVEEVAQREGKRGKAILSRVNAQLVAQGRARLDNVLNPLYSNDFEDFRILFNNKH